MDKKKPRGNPFQKGNQYSKGHGRPKGSTYVQICQKWADEKGWLKLINLAEGKDYRVETNEGKILTLGPDLDLQFQATRLLLEYGYGKPRQAVDIENSSGIPLVIMLPRIEKGESGGIQA